MNSAMAAHTRSLAFLVAVCFVSTACTGVVVQKSPDTSTEFTLTIPEDPSLTALETASSLQDPKEVERGIWSLLVNLNLGVYAPDGRQILAGSETGTEDFWLYDFEVAALKKMSLVRDRNMQDVQKKLHAVGFDVETQELAAFYRVLFDSLPEHYLSQLFKEMDVSFEADADLTRLQEWMLLIALLPPNGQSGDDVSAVPWSSTVMRSGLLSSGFSGVDPSAPHFQEACSNISGNGGDSGHNVRDELQKRITGSVENAVVGTLAEREGAVGLMARFNDMVGKATGVVGKLIDMAKMATLVSNFRVDLDVDPPMTHEVHDQQGEDAEDKRVRVVARVVYEGARVDGEIVCGSYAGVTFPPPGPMQNAGARFRIDEFLQEHGYIRRPSDQNKVRQITDANGEAMIWYEPKNERPNEAQESGRERRGSGDVEVEVDVVSAAGDFFNAFAFMEIFYDLFDVFVISHPIEVRWHEISWAIEVTWKSVSGSLQGDRSDFTWRGTFEVDENGEIHGSGKGTEQGQCTPQPGDDYVAGPFGARWDFQISGQQVGGVFELYFEASDLVMRGNECYNFPENSESLIRYFHVWLADFQGEKPLVVPAVSGQHQGPAPLGQDAIQILLEGPDTE